MLTYVREVPLEDKFNEKQINFRERYSNHSV